jgi:hypothetical protein
MCDDVLRYAGRWQALHDFGQVGSALPIDHLTLQFSRDALRSRRQACIF